MANIELDASNIPVVAKRLASTRSQLGNGKRLLPMTDGRSATARRFKDLYEDICEDLGGIDRLSEGQKQLVRRVAQLSAECERMEAVSAQGERELDLAAYGRATQFIGITLQRLGITRTIRDVSHKPADLRSYLEAFEAEVTEPDPSKDGAP